MRATTRTKEYRLGKLSRWRIYTCRTCGSRFSRELVNPLPVKERICQICREDGNG